jgi:LL-diaminopimelate aminotransferase
MRSDSLSGSPLGRGDAAKMRGMARVNEHYRKLAAGYLFPEIGRRVAAFAAANPQAPIIRLGIGDVTLPLVPAVVDAMRRAVDEMGTAQGFRGYAPDQGYEFLLEAIREDD